MKYLLDNDFFKCEVLMSLKETGKCNKCIYHKFSRKNPRGCTIYGIIPAVFTRRNTCKYYLRDPKISEIIAIGIDSGYLWTEGGKLYVQHEDNIIPEKKVAELVGPNEKKFRFLMKKNDFYFLKEGEGIIMYKTTWKEVLDEKFAQSIRELRKKTLGITDKEDNKDEDISGEIILLELERIKAIHKLSQVYNKKIGKNHKERLIELMQEHTDEIKTLFKNKNKHYLTETGDLIVLCLELLIENEKSVEKVMAKCFQRYEKKLPNLIAKIPGSARSSKRTTSFFRNDLQRVRLQKGLCPVKNCSARSSKIPFHKHTVPFCPEHGLSIHSNSFVYYNGVSKEEKTLSTKRNLMFH